MQFTLRATRQTPHGSLRAWCKQSMSAWSVVESRRAPSNHTNPDLYGLYDMYDLYELAHVTGWEPCNLHDLQQLPGRFYFLGWIRTVQIRY